LVHQEDLGLEDQGPHERHALPHSTRQRGREGVLETLEAGHAHGGRYPPLLRVAPDAAVLEAQRDVPPPGPPREHRALLEHVPHVGGHTRDGPAVDLDDSTGGLEGAAVHFLIARLPAAQRPHGPPDFPLPVLDRTAPAGSPGLRRSPKVLPESATALAPPR